MLRDMKRAQNNPFGTLHETMEYINRKKIREKNKNKACWNYSLLIKHQWLMRILPFSLPGMTMACSLLRRGPTNLGVVWRGVVHCSP